MTISITVVRLKLTNVAIGRYSMVRFTLFIFPQYRVFNSFRCRPQKAELPAPEPYCPTRPLRILGEAELRIFISLVTRTASQGVLSANRTD